MSILARAMIILSVVAAMPWADAAVPSVTIYTTTQLPPVRSAEPVKQFYINLPDLLMQRMSATPGLRAGMTGGQAMAAVTNFHGQQMMNEVSHAMYGLSQAWADGIAYLPAVVIDDTYVLYGVYDVAQARQFVRQYKVKKGIR